MITEIRNSNTKNSSNKNRHNCSYFNNTNNRTNNNNNKNNSNRFEVAGVGSRVYGRVWGSGFRIQGVGLWLDLGYGIQGLGLRVLSSSLLV